MNVIEEFNKPTSKIGNIVSIAFAVLAGALGVDAMDNFESMTDEQMLGAIGSLAAAIGSRFVNRKESQKGPQGEKGVIPASGD